MTRKIRNALAVIACLVSMAQMAGSAAAQAYPAKPVRVIVPFPPGGAADIVARAITQEMGKAWGAQVIVDNRAGAGGLIGAEHVARAVPDGYTLLFASASPMTVSPHLASKPPYHPLRDFTPIVLSGFAPNVIVVHPSLPARSMKEMIALAKARPGQINYASNGVGTLSHLAMELVKHQAGIELVHVPYKGGGPAIADTVAGHTQIHLGSLPTEMAHIRAGKLKVLAVGGKKRNPALPGVPTISEAGVPGYETYIWYGLFAPKGTPAQLISRMHAAVNASIDSPEVVKKLDAQGVVPEKASTAEFGKLMQSGTAKWLEVIKLAGIKGE